MKLDYVLHIALYISLRVDTLVLIMKTVAYYTYSLIHSFCSYALHYPFQYLYGVNNKL
jgi:hypothetical protein